MLTQYSRLTTDQLYLLFCDTQWKNMTDAQCLSALQELENRVAAREGRPAMRVCMMPSQQERPGLNGYYIDGQRSLFLTRRFLANRKNPIFGVKAGEVINTVLHEGRHAFQHEAVRGNVKNISRATMLRWGISFQDYHGGNGGDVEAALYYAQPVEMDARRFARVHVLEIAERIAQLTGAPDRGFEIAINREKVQESAKCAYIKTHLNEAILDRVEAAAKRKFARLNPKEEIAPIDLYREVRKMLKLNGDIDEIDPYLDEIDSEALEAERTDAADSFAQLMERLRRETADARLRRPEQETMRLRVDRRTRVFY